MQLGAALLAAVPASAPAADDSTRIGERTLAEWRRLLEDPDREVRRKSALALDRGR
jgi:hypothetical protein